MNEYQKRVREESLIARAMDIKFREIANRKKIASDQQDQAGDQDSKLIIDQDANTEASLEK